MRIVIAAIAACLVGSGAGWAVAQNAQPYQTPVEPYILSGADIGFRVEAKARDGLVGTLMVRLKNGEWVAVHPAPSRGRVVPLDTK